MLDFLLELLYPSSCGICGELNKDGICNACYEKLKIFIQEKNITKIKNKDKNSYFDELVYMFKYDGIIRNKIIDYKFNSKAYLYKMFLNLILKSEIICGFLKNYDIIIPVPIHKKRRLKRGYNQSELISIKISKDIKTLMYCNDCLVKIKDNTAQSELKKADRIKNVKDVYIIKNKEKIMNKRVILFDDIYTTGSTAKECSRILKNAGCSKVRSANYSKRLKEGECLKWKI